MQCRAAEGLLPGGSRIQTIPFGLSWLAQRAELCLAFSFALLCFFLGEISDPAAWALELQRFPALSWGFSPISRVLLTGSAQLLAAGAPRGPFIHPTPLLGSAPGREGLAEPSWGCGWWLGAWSSRRELCLSRSAKAAQTMPSPSSPEPPGASQGCCPVQQGWMKP